MRTAKRDWWIEREDNAKPGAAETKRHLTVEPGRDGRGGR